MLRTNAQKRNTIPGMQNARLMVRFVGMGYRDDGGWESRSKTEGYSNSSSNDFTGFPRGAFDLALPHHGHSQRKGKKLIEHAYLRPGEHKIQRKNTEIHALCCHDLNPPRYTNLDSPPYPPQNPRGITALGRLVTENLRFVLKTEKRALCLCSSPTRHGNWK